MTITDLINRLNHAPVDFNTVIQVIDFEYHFIPTEFSNGDVINAANSNNGSCKIFSFGQIHGLSQQATLHAFGEFYTKDVLQNPTGDSHQNIRQFIKTGWPGIEFKRQALTKK